MIVLSSLEQQKGRKFTMILLKCWQNYLGMPISETAKRLKCICVSSFFLKLPFIGYYKKMGSGKKTPIGFLMMRFKNGRKNQVNYLPRFVGFPGSSQL